MQKIPVINMMISFADHDFEPKGMDGEFAVVL
jgi:hypothetical protein